MDEAPNSRLLVEVNEASFESEVLRSHTPVLVTFCSPWSRPCKVLDSVLHEVAMVCGQGMKIVKVNADNNPELSVWYDIHSVPTTLYFVEGVLRARVVGTVSKESILSKLL
jgi:thioredoxin 1